MNGSGLKVYLADLLTAGNGAMGLLSVYTTWNRWYALTGACLLTAMIFDGLDGRAARRFGTAHGYGHISDTVADIISWCIGITFLIYIAITDIDSGYAVIALIPAGVYFFSSLARLIRYAQKGYKLKKFEGLPSPGGALMTMVFIFIFGPTPYLFSSTLILTLLITTLAPLMVIPVEYPKIQGRWAVPLVVLSLIVCAPGIYMYLITRSYQTIETMTAALVAFILMAGYLISGPVHTFRAHLPSRKK